MDVGSPFTKTLRALDAARQRGGVVSLLVVSALIALWIGWAALSSITLYETAPARLELEAKSKQPLVVLATSRVERTRLALGLEVKKGDVLVELECEATKLQLSEAQLQLQTLQRQLDALQRQLELQGVALSQRRDSQKAHLAEVEARREGTETVAKVAAEAAERNQPLAKSGMVNELTSLKLQAEAKAREEEVKARGYEADRVRAEQRAQVSTSRADLARLEQEHAALQGQVDSTSTAILRLNYEIEKHLVRAPMDGTVADVAEVKVGAMVQLGAELGTVVSAGSLQLVAGFIPAVALGRLKPGQPAQIRFDGFPWTQYGTMDAEVQQVAREAREGLVRVELKVFADSNTKIPLQHGLPATVEVAVEQVSPLALLLRTAGGLIQGGPAEPAEPVAEGVSRAVTP